MKFWAKSAKAFSRKLEFCKKTRFYLIPMGFTTVGRTHVYHVDKGQLGLILINVLETCTTLSKRSHNIMLSMICSTCLHWTCHRNSFVATKNKFEVLHLPHLINDVQYHSLFCLSLQHYWNQRNILTCSIIWLLKYCYTIRWLNKILNVFFVVVL